MHLYVAWSQVQNAKTFSDYRVLREANQSPRYRPSQSRLTALPSLVSYNAVNFVLDKPLAIFPSIAFPLEALVHQIFNL